MKDDKFLKSTTMEKVFMYSFIGVSVLIFSGCAKEGVAERETSIAQSPAIEQVQTKDVQESEDTTFRGSVTKLIAMGKPQKCVWSDDNGNRGVTYVDGKRMRADIESVVEEVEQKQAMINDGAWMYTWDVVTRKGQKMKLADMEAMQERFASMGDGTLQEDVSSQRMQNINPMDGKYEFTCEKWRTDDQKFAPPSDVVFEDMGAQFQQAQQALDSLSDQCATLPEAQRKVCAEAMEKFAQ